MNTKKKNQQFCSAMIITLSGGINKLKQQAFSNIKYKYLSQQIKKIDKIGDTSSKAHQSKDSYQSIADFKPINNNYSSVKIFDGQCTDFDNFQTKKQEIHKHMEMEQNKSGMVQLEHWMIFQKAKQCLPQNYPKSEYCSRDISTYSENALEMIKNFKFEVFCKTVLKEKKSWLNQEKDPLKYKTNPIKNSIVSLSEQQTEEALDLFQLLLIIGGDLRSESPWIYCLWKFVCQLYERDENFIEEAYFQAIKQIESLKISYFRVFCCLCCLVKPSTRMYIPLLNYIYTQNLAYPQYSEIYNYCFFNLVKNFNDPHKVNPSMFDLFCISQMRKIPLMISFPREKLFFMEPYSKAEELLEELVKFYALDDSVSYLINVQGTLMSNGYILDSVNKYLILDNDEQEIQERHWSRFKQFTGYKAYIVLKNMAIFQKSIGTFLIMFNHLIEQFRKGLFLLNLKELTRIGGLLMHSEMETEQFFQFSLGRYLSRNRETKKVSNQTLIKLRSHILRNYYTFKGTKIQARKEIVNILRSSKVFLAHFFYGDVLINDQNQFDAFLGIQPGIILIIDPDNNRIMMKIEFKAIQKWGKSKSQVCFKVKQIGNLHFQCKGTELLASIYQEYLDYFCKQLSSSQSRNV